MRSYTSIDSGEKKGMRIDYSKRFLKRLEKCPPQIIEAFQERLKIFIGNRFHLLLNNHALTGAWRRYRSINVTGDWRAVYQELEGGSVAYFIAIGTHSQLYSSLNFERSIQKTAI